jgi:hypothetical protein
MNPKMQTLKNNIAEMQTKVCKEEKPVLEAYADEQYKKLLKEKDQYISLDDSQDPAEMQVNKKN